MILLRLGKGIISGLGVGNQARPMEHNIWAGHGKISQIPTNRDMEHGQAFQTKGASGTQPWRWAWNLYPQHNGHNVWGRWFSLKLGRKGRFFKSQPLVCSYRGRKQDLQCFPFPLPMLPYPVQSLPPWKMGLCAVLSSCSLIQGLTCIGGSSHLILQGFGQTYLSSGLLEPRQQTWRPSMGPQNSIPIFFNVPFPLLKLTQNSWFL